MQVRECIDREGRALPFSAPTTGPAFFEADGGCVVVGGRVVRCAVRPTLWGQAQTEFRPGRGLKPAPNRKPYGLMACVLGSLALMGASSFVALAVHPAGWLPFAVGAAAGWLSASRLDKLGL